MLSAGHPLPTLLHIASSLERLGLIRSHHNIDRETGIPKFDQFTGKIAVSYRSLTPIGEMLLKQIELYEVENA